MILTDKCKEEFLKNYMFDNESFNYYPSMYQNALIIEFFDNIGLYIFIDRSFFFDDWSCKIIGHYKENHFNSRSEATQSALTKANEIFNNLNK